MAITPSPTGISIGQALQDGWQVFRRTPWPFVSFVLLSFGFSLALDWLPTPADNLASGLVNLWVSIGLMRGVWLGLQGKQPTFGDLIKLNPGATWRLFSRQFVLGLLLTLISGGAFALAVNAAQASPMVEELVSLSVGPDGSDPSQLPVLLAALQALGLQLLSSPVAMLLAKGFERLAELDEEHERVNQGCPPNVEQQQSKKQKRQKGRRMWRQRPTLKKRKMNKF